LHMEWTTPSKMNPPEEGMGTPPPGLVTHMAHVIDTYAQTMKSKYTYCRRWTFTLVDKDTMDLEWRLTLPPLGGGTSWGRPIGGTTLRYKRMPE
jgi:hypothetical protein